MKGPVDVHTLTLPVHMRASITCIAVHCLVGVAYKTTLFRVTSLSRIHHATINRPPSSDIALVTW